MKTFSVFKFLVPVLFLAAMASCERPPAWVGAGGSKEAYVIDPIKACVHCPDSNCQTIPAADMKVAMDNIELQGDELVCKVHVSNIHQNTAKNVRLTVNLPVDAPVVGVEVPSGVNVWYHQGYILFGLPAMNPKPDSIKTIIIRTKRFITCNGQREICRNKKSLESFSAFVTSDVADHNKENNYVFKYYNNDVCDPKDDDDNICNWIKPRKCLNLGNDGKLVFTQCLADPTCGKIVQVPKICQLSKCFWCDGASKCAFNVLEIINAEDFNITPVIVDDQGGFRPLKSVAAVDGTIKIEMPAEAANLKPSQQIVLFVEPTVDLKEDRIMKVNYIE